MLQWTCRSKSSSKNQLSRMHPRFFHAGASTFFNLIKRPRPEEVTSKTLTTSKDISKRCNLCHGILLAPSRFRLTRGVGNLHFNKSIIIDIIHINKYSLLHIVDETTRFRDVRFLPSVSIEPFCRISSNAGLQYIHVFFSESSLIRDHNLVRNSFILPISSIQK